MRLRHKKGAESDILSSPYCIQIEENNEAKDPMVFFADNKSIEIELGMGKGRFICETAIKNPDTNFIGIEKSATIVLKACENYKIFNEPQNLKFLCTNVENLERIFIPHSINKIYLNFSDPWPKKRHENRRLTSKNFLILYEKLLKKDGTIEFKTDNKDLFDFSLEEIKNSNFELLDFTYDLHHDPNMNDGNIMTEYEEKWSTRGQLICKLICKTNY